MPPKKEPEVKISFFAHPDPFVEFVFIVLFVLIAIYLVNGFLAMLASANVSPIVWLRRILDLITSNSLIMWYVRIFLAIIAVVCLYFILYYTKKLKELRVAEHKSLYPEMVPTTVSGSKNLQWQPILDHIESTNENDWRQAILESDIMLADLLDKLNLPGDTMGDKLKAVDKSDFLSIDSAWEAHKTRNQIAHEGAKFLLNQREARNVIAMYQTVFEEFRII